MVCCLLLSGNDESIKVLRLSGGGLVVVVVASFKCSLDEAEDVFTLSNVSVVSSSESFLFITIFCVSSRSVLLFEFIDVDERDEVVINDDDEGELTASAPTPDSDDDDDSYLVTSLPKFAKPLSSTTKLSI